MRERKDVELILGQGMPAGGWHAHTLNVPGDFLISAPEHDTPVVPAAHRRRLRARREASDGLVREVAGACPLSWLQPGPGVVRARAKGDGRRPVATAREVDGVT